MRNIVVSQGLEAFAQLAYEVAAGRLVDGTLGAKVLPKVAACEHNTTNSSEGMRRM